MSVCSKIIVKASTKGLICISLVFELHSPLDQHIKMLDTVWVRAIWKVHKYAQKLQHSGSEQLHLEWHAFAGEMLLSNLTAQFSNHGMWEFQCLSSSFTTIITGSTTLYFNWLSGKDSTIYMLLAQARGRCQRKNMHERAVREFENKLANPFMSQVYAIAKISALDVDTSEDDKFYFLNVSRRWIPRR